MSIVNKPPTSIQVEPIFYCNRRCDFCPNCKLTGSRNKYRFMSNSLSWKISYEIAILTDGGNHLRLDMALRGEPLLHPFLPAIVETFRNNLPKAQISIVSNGFGLTVAKADKLFRSGLNFLYLDCYNNSYDKWKEKFSVGVPPYLMVCDSDDISHWKWHGCKKRVLVLGKDLVDETRTTRKLVSFCKALPKENCEKYGIVRQEEPKMKTCVDPFRSMNITWDGKVLLCCRDWDEKRVMFDFITDEDLVHYWFHDTTLKYVRTLLQHKNRNFRPCDNCEYNGGVYTGNLPKVKTYNALEIERFQEFLERT